MTTVDVLHAHKHSSWHRNEILASKHCGCFYRCEVFDPAEIKEWVDEFNAVGQTAICPRCGIDSVLGSNSGYPITMDFLRAMKGKWF